MKEMVNLLETDLKLKLLNHTAENTFLTFEHIDPDKTKNECKIVLMFLSTSLNFCFGFQKNRLS